VFFERKSAAPGWGCLITIISTFMDKILFAVSTKVSPLLTLDDDAEKLIMSADSLFLGQFK
jgi:hypothetical protein